MVDARKTQYILRLAAVSNFPQTKKCSSYKVFQPPETEKQIEVPFFIVASAVHVYIHIKKIFPRLLCYNTPTRYSVHHPPPKKEKNFSGKIDGSSKEGLLNKNTMEKWILQFMTNDSLLSGCGAAWYGAARQAMMRVQAWRAVPTNQQRKPTPTKSNLDSCNSTTHLKISSCPQ